MIRLPGSHQPDFLADSKTAREIVSLSDPGFARFHRGRVNSARGFFHDAIGHFAQIVPASEGSSWGREGIVRAGRRDRILRERKKAGLRARCRPSNVFRVDIVFRSD